MSKKGQRYFASSTSATDKKSLYDRDDDRPDPKSKEFYDDEVDEFHAAREKFHLDRARPASPASSDEEVYKVRVDSDDDNDDDDDDDDDEDNEEANDADMQSDIEENTEDYLPSADAWGKNRKTFYSTDYVDKDYGGISESDEEAAELEEKEARSMQKRLAMQMDEDDFRLSMPEDQTTEKVAVEEPEDQTAIDVTQLNDKEKLKLLQLHHPELLSLIEEYKKKKEIVDNQLKPIVDSLIDGTLPSTKCLNFIRLRFEAYSNYLLNIHFYFLLKASNSSIKNHPIIERIVEWKKVINDIDEKCVNLDDDLKILCDKLANREDLSSIDFIDSETTIDKSIEKINISSKQLKDSDDEEEDKNDDQFYEFEEDPSNSESQAKRAATYEILKNKGTTPKRKKENRNPRVKHRMKFQKALHKKRSQVPDVKRELSKYGGEERGIKTNLVKSVKLR